MDNARLAGFRARLEAALADLDAEDALGVEGQKTVELDQQSVGRLSRIYALQGQAMARATRARRAASRKRILAALARIDEDEYGYCVDCGEEIAAKRLDLDPALPRCIACASG